MELSVTKKIKMSVCMNMTSKDNDRGTAEAACEHCQHGSR
jgi:hypothetical protein